MLSTSGLIRSCDAVVFDCAGTLLRLDPSRETIFEDAAAELGIKLPSRSIARAYEMVDFALKIKSSQLSSNESKSRFYFDFNFGLCGALGIEKALERLHPLLVRRFTERRHWVAFADAAETLREIRRYAPVHALANWDEGLESVLAQAGLRDILRDVAASAALGAEKPARACFDAFLKRNALVPGRVVYVGNEYLADVVGARKAGLLPILLDRHDHLPAADCMRIRRLRDLISPNLER
ncbi:MAG: HAD family hydrolase [Acidobacteriaceae bacterium]|nr:HAD family hydrolase [Acidobacteriaceae bacterium]